MVFVYSPSGVHYCATIDALHSTLDHYKPNTYYLRDGKRILTITQALSLPSDADLWLCLRLPGGKGGFGSNLRAQGNRLSHPSRSGTLGSCRDLTTGLRLRDIRSNRIVREWREEGGNEAVERERLRALAERHQHREAERESRERRVVEERCSAVVEQAHGQAERMEQTILDCHAIIMIASGEDNNNGHSSIMTRSCGWEDELLTAVGSQSTK